MVAGARDGSGGGANPAHRRTRLLRAIDFGHDGAMWTSGKRDCTGPNKCGSRSLAGRSRVWRARRVEAALCAGIGQALRNLPARARRRGRSTGCAAGHIHDHLAQGWPVRPRQGGSDDLAVRACAQQGDRPTAVTSAPGVFARRSNGLPTTSRRSWKSSNRSQDAARLDDCLEELDERARTMIRAAFFDGASYPELAEREAVPLGR